MIDSFARRVVVLGIAAAALSGCCNLPPLDGRSQSTAFPDTVQTRLGLSIAPRVAGHQGESGIHLLADSHDAFAARMLLARRADRSLDVQYYIWHLDMTGIR